MTQVKKCSGTNKQEISDVLEQLAWEMENTDGRGQPRLEITEEEDPIPISEIDLDHFLYNGKSYFSFQQVLYDWCNKGRGMYYPVCGMVHIKEPLLLIDKSSLCGGSGFPFSLSEWSLTICLTPYNRR